MAKGQAIAFPQEFRLRCVEALQTGTSYRDVRSLYDHAGRRPSIATLKAWERELAVEPAEVEEHPDTLQRMEEVQGQALERISQLIGKEEDLRKVAQTWNWLMERGLDIARGKRSQGGVHIENAIIGLREMTPEQLREIALRGPAAQEDESSS